jgi:CRP-like cAMP-binding protein
MEQSRSALEPLVERLSYQVPLDNEDRLAVLALPHRIRTLRRGEQFVREGAKATHCALMLSGFTIRHKIVAKGARQILAIQMKGDFVDLQNSFLGIADHNVEALTAAKLAFIPREELQKLMFSRPAVGTALMIELLVEGSITRVWTATGGRRDAWERIAHLRCDIGFRLEAAGLAATCDFELPMTQDQIADTVGLTPVHVNRTLMALDAEGITNRTKRAVIVDDWQKLAAAGDFNDLYLHSKGVPARLQERGNDNTHRAAATTRG